MDLYTSLTRLKQAMNDGRLPPMTPVPEKVHHLIDPAFTIGLGALEEDPVKGLRCPVRGCGVYRHSLTRHLDTKHRALGGAKAVRRALSIPSSAGLVSHLQREILRTLAASKFAGRAKRWTREELTAISRRTSARRGASRRSAMATVGSKNLLNHCVAQTRERITRLQVKLGRLPNPREFRSEYGAAMFCAIERAFGTWNSALASCGLAVRGRYKHYDRDAVLAALASWYEAHGSLPRSSDATSPHRTPIIPGYQTILSALGTDSWPKAMQIAAALLDIHGGRYGLPVKKPA